MSTNLLLPQATLRGHLEGVSALQFWNGSRYLVSGDYSGKLILWNVNNRVPCWIDEKTHTNSAIMEVYPSPYNMESFYSHDKTGLVVHWQCVDGELVATSRSKDTIHLEASQKFHVGYSGISRSSMFHNLLAVARSMPQDSLVIYDVSSNGSLEKPIISFDHNENFRCGFCTLVGFLNEQVVMTLHEDGSIKLWSLSRQEMTQHLKFGSFTLLSYDKYSHSSHWKVLIGGTHKTLGLFDFDGQILKEESKCPLKKGGIGDISVRDDERILAVAHWDTKVRLYEIRNQFRQLVTLPHNNQR
ncbi:uncharacterized protein Gasu_46640 [Galdieria sulphuraria]|uniref:Uncharacterized protein n=1 Tax=Galdieria sulphuraria TaxID=130081 RepID=M2XW65_GALSU|nr:uncharacterized protein Gasu_46640 [Galdieria sulphuraria]EME27843.1 hypothetical protein Gasu_46640 [Galdieria sulphuraria]|eukprot:XP_005704363.1 hypothetical protein Gasu_46640 [Galdieria sulphuraria]